MKIILHPEGDLRKAIQRIERNSDMNTSEVALMLCQNGLIKYTGTMEDLMKKEDHKNKWYIKIWRKR